MSNKTEKETGRGRHIRGGGLKSSSNNSAGTSRLSCLEKSSDVTPKKCSTNKTKKPEEPSVTAKKNTKVDVLENEPRNSGAKTASTSASRLRPSAEVPLPTNKRPAVKQTAPSVAQKEAKARQEEDRVAQGPSIRKRPVPPANKTVTKNGTSDPQVKREKAQPDSSAKKSSVRKQQAQPSGSTSKPPTKTTNTSAATNSSKLKKSAIQKQISSNKPSPNDQSSRGKQAKHKASTSGLNLNLSNYPGHYIQWKGFEESSNRLDECCRFCEKDIRVGPVASNRGNEFSAIPVVAVLPCGHIFHNDCLSVGELGGQQAEPRCFFCDRC